MNDRIRPIRRKRWPDDVYERAEELLNGIPPLSAPAIARRLEDELEEATPSGKTIGDWIRSGVIGQSDAAKPWSVADAAPEDARGVLEVIRHLMELHADPGSPAVRLRLDRNLVAPFRWPTRAHGRWIVRIRRGFPESTDLGLVALLARDASRGGEDLRRVESFLAFSPWLDGGVALASAYTRGLVGFDVPFTYGFGDQAVAAMSEAHRRSKKGDDDEQR